MCHICRTCHGCRHTQGGRQVLLDLKEACLVGLWLGKSIATVLIRYLRGQVQVWLRLLDGDLSLQNRPGLFHKPVKHLHVRGIHRHFKVVRRCVFDETAGDDDALSDVREGVPRAKQWAILAWHARMERGEKATHLSQSLVSVGPMMGMLSWSRLSGYP